MPALWTSPRFFAGNPDILNVEDAFSFSLPLVNRGTAPAANIVLTDITLGGARRTFPIDMPMIIGNLATDNLLLVNARFDNSGLVYGAKVIIEISGTYESTNATYRFSVNREIQIPPIVAAPIKFLNARLGVSRLRGKTSYTLFNDEGPASPHHINAFSLELVSPATSIRAPKGWAVDTDYRSHILWYAKEEDGQSVPPGTSIEGFELRSEGRKSEPRAFTITSWNQEHKEAGPVYLGSIPSSN